MNERGHALFETSVGTCGIAWDERGIVALELPDATREATRERLGRRAAHPEGTPPRAVREAIAAITRHLAGEAQDLREIELVLEGIGPFHAKVYRAAREIPPGRTATYGELARAVGSPGAARAVGQALGRNPFPIVVPCHRVLASGGKPGGFSAPGGRSTKARLLALEGVTLETEDPPAALFRGRAALPYDAEAALEHLRRRDPTLGRLVDAVGPFRLQLDARGGVFGLLLSAIVHQQLTGKAARTILGRVVALFAPKRFPAPADVLGASEEALRGCGLSRAKVAAARELAAKTLDGTVPSLARLRRLEDAAILERLTQVRGIGRWTVEMLLIFSLGRPDVLPDGDYGVRKGFAIAYGLDAPPTLRDLVRAGEAWRPFRSVASWYLWRALELPAPAKLRESCLKSDSAKA